MGSLNGLPRIAVWLLWSLSSNHHNPAFRLRISYAPGIRVLPDCFSIYIYQVIIDVIMPTPKETAAFVETVQESVHSGELDTYTAAREAVWHGFLMIGTKQSRPEHHPVPLEEHTFKDIRYGCEVVPIENASPKMLRATGVAELAIANALWGDSNSRSEKEACIRSITGEYSEDTIYFGAGYDADETRRRTHKVAAVVHEDGAGPNKIVIPRCIEDILRASVCLHLHPRERIAYKIHARPSLINAAIGPNPLTGSIDFVADDIDPLEDYPKSVSRIHDGSSAWVPFPRQEGSWLIDQPQKTVFSLPVTGADLPTYIPRRYEEEPR